MAEPASPVLVEFPDDIKHVKTTKVKKPAVPKVSKPKIKREHPSTSEMVITAIEKLAERSGSSLPAIKKYLATNYKVDIEKQSLFIKKYLKSAVSSGSIIQVKGKGANGSFKLAKKPVSFKPKLDAAKKPVMKKVTAKKIDEEKPVRKPTVSKKAPVKKAPVDKKAPAEKKTSKPAVTKTEKPKALSKTKKSTKSPTAKPKAPKPKKVAAPKVPKTSAKKTAAQKK